MTASQLPGQTFEPIPANPGPSSDDELSLWQKAVELTNQIAGGGSHADPVIDDQFSLMFKFVHNLNLISL